MKKISLLAVFLLSQAFAQTSFEFNVPVNDNNLSQSKKTNNDDIIIDKQVEENAPNSEVLFVQENKQVINHWQFLIQSEKKDYEAIKDAIDKGSDINQTVINNLNALELAGMQNNLQLTRFILSYKPDLFASNKNNENPIHWAATSNEPNIIKEELMYLNSKDISNLINKVNKDQKNALHFNALYAGNLEIAQVLINDKININASDKNGQTPLHYAMSRKNWDLAAFLIKNGADIKIKDNNDSSSEDYLIERGDINGYLKLYSYMSESTKKFIESRLNSPKYYYDSLERKS